MTLRQLEYVIAVSETGTITEAANRLYISQPSLTNSIHELEKEMNIHIFNRTNKGITLSKEGEDFLGYARQVLEQAAILEDRYKRNGGGKKQFCVSTQHYSFAVNALFLEYDDTRSGGFAPLAKVSPDKKVVLGLITTKSPVLEDKEKIISRIHEAAKYISLDRLCLSPQCGFASCEIGNKLTEEEQWAKLKLVKEIAEEVWG